jgi:hypothetical protein
LDRVLFLSELLRIKNIFVVHVIKASRGIGCTAPLIFNLGARWRRESTSRPGRFNPRQGPRYPLNSRPGEPKADFERISRKKKSLHELGLETRIVQPVA